ncbi:MAG: FAD-dependent oxidoreductase [Candidatus Aminicenantes bacterium]|nr:FAD-dependent oxidoreductase [Candidatus Aminicenantes bacterium]
MDIKKENVHNNKQAEILEADIAIIGAGSAGLSAALTAASGGAKVIVFEKMLFPGGYSLMSEGMFAVESKIQIESNIGITKDEAFNHHMEGTHWCANARLVRVFIDKSADTIDWLRQMGVEYIKAATLWPGGPRTWHLMKGGGKALIQVLAQKAGEKGVELITGKAAVKLLMDKKNRAAGVIAADKDGNTVQANARVVIIAGGGFVSNKEMLRKYVKLPFDAIPVIDMGQTGEHIRMAFEFNAGIKDPNVILSTPAVPGEKPTSHLWAAASQPHLWVNKLGERFCNESIAFQFPFSANALKNQLDGIMYTIFDEQTKRDMMNKGISVSLGVFVPVTTKLTRLEAEIQQGIKEGKVFVADSIKGLAGKIGLNISTFKSTVDEFNSFTKKHQDKIFAKNRRYLKPIEDTPFYAIKSTLHIFTTLGGIKINYKTEVLTEKSEPIPGLYAVGNCTGGMYGLDYDIFTSGGALGFAVNSGRISGDNALEYIGKNNFKSRLKGDK